MSHKKKFFLAALVPTLVLLLMTFVPLSTWIWGQEIQLETIPFDPRDMFRGDHVVLNYKISQVSLSKMPIELKSELEQDAYRYYGKNMYAILKKNGSYYDVDHISLSKPQGGLYLKCRFNYLDQMNSDPMVNLSYYLDKYFVPENTGLELEELSRQGKLVATIKVFKGYALLTGINQAE